MSQPHSTHGAKEGATYQSLRRKWVDHLGSCSACQAAVVEHRGACLYGKTLYTDTKVALWEQERVALAQAEQL